MLHVWRTQAVEINICILQDYTIPAGHMMLLSPYWSHRNPKYFPEPDTFKPVRSIAP